MEHKSWRRVVRQDTSILPRSLVWGAWLVVAVLLLLLLYLYFIKGHC